MKKKSGRKKVKNIDADLDVELENYEPSDSDDGFNANERSLLSNAVGRKVQKGEEEVLKVYSSSDESDNIDDDDDVDDDDDDDDDKIEDEKDSEDEKNLYGGGEIGSDMDSDIEGKSEDDGLPDSKAWGADRKQYYDTDYVDKDYLDFDDEEAAIEEEKEADAIQRRLMSHLEGTDFTLGLLDAVEGKKNEATKKRSEPHFEEDGEKVKVDLSKLSKDEFIDLMKRKNPEMFPIINKCKERLKYLEEKVAPILELVDNNLLQRSKVIDFLEYFHQITLHYAVNVLFYVHLKELGIRTSDHSVIKRLDGLNLLIGEMDVLRKKVDPQIDIILEKAANGEELNADPEPENPVEPEPKNRKEKRKRKLVLLKKQEDYKQLVAQKKQKLMKVQKVTFEEALSKKQEKPVIYSDEESEEEEAVKEEEEEEEKEKEISGDKRAVTFAMLKNKGLTPRRKKENRNPRVKHRNKFKKALVRRKGQVREPRKELTKYGGEFTGINPFVSKSIQIK